MVESAWSQTYVSKMRIRRERAQYFIREPVTYVYVCAGFMERVVLERARLCRRRLVMRGRRGGTEHGNQISKQRFPRD